MHIFKVTWQGPWNFCFKARCRHCRRESYFTDGRATLDFHRVELPARHCKHCGKNEEGNQNDV